VRVVDIPEVFARELRDYVVGTNGFLFATAEGKSLQQRNVLRVLHGVKSVGFHAFRRFRLTWLRKNGVPKDLERYWKFQGFAEDAITDATVQRTKAVVVQLVADKCTTCEP
jgi:integrase